MRRNTYNANIFFVQTDSRRQDYVVGKSMTKPDIYELDFSSQDNSSNWEIITNENTGFSPSVWNWKWQSWTALGKNFFQSPRIDAFKVPLGSEHQWSPHCAWCWTERKKVYFRHKTTSSTYLRLMPPQSRHSFTTITGSRLTSLFNRYKSSLGPVRKIKGIVRHLYQPFWWEWSKYQILDLDSTMTGKIIDNWPVFLSTRINAKYNGRNHGRPSTFFGTNGPSIRIKWKNKNAIPN